jgi:hypothetical protein
LTFTATSVADTLAGFVFTQSGTNGGTSNFHVGTRNPEGFVTGNGGALYIRDDSTNSNLYIKRTDGGNTGWNEIGVGGDVDGPGSSTDNRIALFSGVTGKLLKDSSNITIANTNQITGATDVSVRTTSATHSIALETLAHTDTVPTVQMASSAASVDFHVGTQNPEGAVTANPGSVYLRKNGTSSAIYVLESTSAANTPWHNLVSASSGVTGPVSSINNHIVTYNGTTGKIIKQGEDTVIRAESAVGNPQLIIQSSVGSSDLALSANYLTNDSNLGSNLPLTIETFGSSDLTLRTANGNIDVDLETANTEFSIAGTLHTDTNSIFAMGTSGANGGQTNIHVGNRNPEGNIVGNGGALYIRDDGANSDLYIKKSDGGNTGWADITSDGDVTGPGSSVDNSFVLFNGTTGKVIDDAPQFTYFTSGNQRATVFDSPNASGVIGHQLHISTGGIRAAWEFNESLQSTDFVHAGTGNFRIAQDSVSSTGDLQLQNNGTAGGNITATTAFSGGNISLTSGATSGNVNVVTEGVTWNFDGDVFRTSASSASATQIIEFRDNLASTTTTMQNINAISTFDLTSSYIVRIGSGATGGTQVINSNAAGGFSVDNTTAPDTSATITLDQGGTNGGVSSVFLGNRNPEGNVAAQGGSVYIQDNSSDSNLYLKTSDTGSTDWNKVKIEGASNQTVAVISHPLTSSSLSVGIQTTDLTIPFSTDLIETDSARLDANQANNFIEVNQVTDTTNGDLYRVDFTCACQGPSGRVITFSIDAIQNGNPNLTQLVCQEVMSSGLDEQTLTMSGVVRGPNTTVGVSGFRVLFRGSSSGQTLFFNSLSLSVERLS